MSKRVKATAEVRVSLKVMVPRTWDEDSTIWRILEEAEKMAINIISKTIIDSPNQIEMVGDPKVVAILAEHDEKI